MRRAGRLVTVALAVCLAAVARRSSATTYDWQPSASDPDNVITNESHFTVPLASLTPADALSIKATADMTVRMPAGTYRGNLSPYFNVAPGCTLTYDGPGAWVQTNVTSGSYIAGGKNHFEILTQGNGIFNYAVDAQNGTYSFTNVKFRLRRAATGSETWFDLDRGTMNLLDPNGTSLGGDNLYTVNGSATPIRLSFHEGSTLRAPTLLIYGEHEKTYFTFDGGRNHYIGTYSPRGLNAGADTSVDRTTLLVTGADTMLSIGKFTYGNTTHHRYRVDVVSNATLSVANVDQSARAETDRFRVTDATLVFGYAGQSQPMWVAPNIVGSNMTFQSLGNIAKFTSTGFVRATNSTFTLKAFALADNVDFGMTGGSLSATGASYIGSGSGTTKARFDGASLAFADILYVGNACTAEMTLTNTTLTTTGASQLLMVGSDGGSTGTLNVQSGSTVDCAYRIVLSGWGNATMNVGPGATVRAAALYGYWNKASGKTVRLNQTGGLVSVGGVSLIAEADVPNSTAVCQLDGGEFRTAYLNGGASSAASSSYTSTAYLKGNGGTIVATAASTEFIRNMNGIQIGANGLTISSAYDITIPQSVANDGSAKGRLVLTGSGVKTLSGTATTVSEIEIAEGTLRFATGARAASTLVVRGGAKVVFEEDPANIGFKELQIGDGTTAGTVALSAGQSIAVAGAVAISAVQLELTGDYAVDTTYQLVRATSAGSAATRAAWVDARVVSGAAEDRSYVFSVDATSSPHVFKMRVSGYAYEIFQPSGTATDSEDRTIGAVAVGHVDVSSGSKLTLSGHYEQGGMTKTGSGTLYLTGIENVFYRQICSQGGLFSVADMRAIGTDESAGFVLQADTFEYTGSGQTYLPPFVFKATNNTSVVVIKNDGDLTLADVTTVSGAPLKRGAGKLTIAPASGTTTVLATGNGSSTNGYDPADYSGFSMSADGTAPTKGHLGFNILEGTVEIVGDATTTVNIPYAVNIGMSNTDAVKSRPCLRIDGAKVNLAVNGNNRVMLGCFIMANTQAAYPRAEIVNGATMTCGSWMAGRHATVASWPTTVVDRATANLGAFCAGWSTSSRPTYLFRNGSKVYSSSMTQYGPAWVDVEDSTWTTSGGGCFAYDSHMETAHGSWRVGTNGVLACSKFTFQSAATGGNRLFLYFDGGTWKTGDGAHPTFHIYQSQNLVISTRTEEGLTLPVSASNTVDVARAIGGTGGLVKTGAGTLHFETQGTWNSDLTVKTELGETVSLAFEGPLDVREGAVTIDPEACRADGTYRTSAGASIDFGGNVLGVVTLAGGGAFANATATDSTLALTLRDDRTLEGHPTLTDVTLDGRTYVDFGRTNVLEKAATDLVVATFPNGAPDVSKWRGINAGEGYCASFRVAANGQDVLADVGRSGLVVIIR